VHLRVVIVHQVEPVFILRVVAVEDREVGAVAEDQEVEVVVEDDN
jgi:hypothetical protein